MADSSSIEIHKALADDSRLKLYRYLRLTGRPVSVREMSARLSLHPNTLRPHLRRLEEAGLISRETGKSDRVGRPRTLYSVAEPGAEEGSDYRLLLEIVVAALRGRRSVERVEALARDWGAYLVAQDVPKPGAKNPARRNLAVVQEAMARAGFDPRFRRSGAKRVEVILRDCPARDLADENRDVICALHRGLIQGMLEGVKPALSLEAFEPLVEKTRCRVTARG